MKKVINGKMYNTETAKRVGYVWYDNSRYARPEEELYLKKTGEFFLWSIPSSLYVLENDLQGYNGVYPLSEEEAKAWAEKNLDGEEYVELFGEVEE